jgi:hypothetical protein
MVNRPVRLFSSALAMLAWLAAVPSPAAAARGTDAVPAATLLIPYFEVSLPKKIGGKPKGVTTLLTVNNASATAALTNVVIWSDLGVPVLKFNMYLTGYDVQQIDLQQVLTGTIPQTGAADSGSQCADHLPPASPLDVGTVGHVRALLTGKASPISQLCAGRDLGDLVARGYVTIDNVNDCSADTPADFGYFSPGGFGIASNQNQLWGEAEIVDRQKKLGVGNLLVHVEAFTGEFGAGDRTFYGRYVGNNGSDGREPLPSTFGIRYRNIPKDKLFPQGTTVFVWRDTQSTAAQQFACGSSPAGLPVTDIVAFDEQENAQDVVAQPFPAATQRIKTGGPALPLGFPAGWFYVNLAFGGLDRSQAWVVVFEESKGRNSVSQPAIGFD